MPCPRCAASVTVEQPRRTALGYRTFCCPACRRVCNERTGTPYNRLEQDHRGIKQRYYPMRGFGSFASAARFCTGHDELRDHFRYRQHMNETISLAAQRRLF